jgi:hypothetical protein
MRHLSPSEFVDLADGVLDPSRTSHVERCKECRAHAQALRSVMQEARATDVPDPSPLFWDHFQRRVRQAVDADPAPRRSWFAVRPAVAFTAAMVLCVGVAFGTLYPRSPEERPVAVPRAPAAAATAGFAREASDDPAWTLLRDVAADMAIEDAHAAGMTVGPSAAENAVLELTPAERDELGRLLQDALKQAGA